MNEYLSEVFVYTIDISGSLLTYGELIPLLSAGRRRYCDRIGNEKRRLESAYAYALLRYALSEKFGVNDKPELSLGEHGKPYLKDIGGIFFSLSHSEGLVLCAVSDKPVGADIQTYRELSRSIAGKICSPEEIKELPQEDGRALSEKLCEIWCVKESYSKLTGKGYTEGFGGICAAKLTESGSAVLIKDSGFDISICVNGKAAVDTVRKVSAAMLCERLTESPVSPLTTSLVRSDSGQQEKVCVVFGGGSELPEKTEIPKNAFVAAADSGLRTLEALGIKPDLTVGDFDSYGEIPETDNIKVLPHEKDLTDMDEAVRQGLSRGCDTFLIYGGTGGRADHTAANIQLIARLSQSGRKALLYGRDTVITAVSDGGSISLGKRESGYVSVLAFTDVCTGVNISGLKYTAEDITLKNTFALGVSNEFTGKKAEISVKTGTLLIFFPVS